MKFIYLSYILSLTFFTLVHPSTLSAQTLDIATRKAHFNLDKVTPLAMQGYDPVSYFTQDQPVQGTNRLTFSYQGVSYLFSTEENRTLFIQNPEQYEPQYGGWCAYAMVRTRKVKIDPLNFIIQEGKLYLFYKTASGNTKDRWEKSSDSFQKSADSNWKTLTDM